MNMGWVRSQMGSYKDYWILLGALSFQRLVFVFYHHSHFDRLSGESRIRAFSFGALIDSSTAALMILGGAFVFWICRKAGIRQKWCLGIYRSVLSLPVLLNVGDLFFPSGTTEEELKTLEKADLEKVKARIFFGNEVPLASPAVTGVKASEFERLIGEGVFFLPGLCA